LNEVETIQMKSLYALAAVIAFSAAPAFAGEGHVSTNSLAKMGLAGMQTMNDAQGMNIRGLSVAVVSGGSIATIHGEGGSASSFNTYFAAGHKSAEGSNVSFAADGTIKTYGSHVMTTTNFVVAGGASQASAK
jgi:hypothetical protein